MKEIQVTIKSESGLHARPASVIVSKTTQFKCNITVSKGDKKANLKSLLAILSLAAGQGDILTIKTDGVDEADAMDVIQECGSTFGLW